MTTPQKIVYINYFDGIDDQKVRALMAICSDIIAQQKPEALYFLFASGGGYVNAGIVFHNFLRSLPTKIIMHNMGIIDSTATVIFLAGEERYASPHSSFLFHGVQWTFNQPISLPANKLTEISSQLKQDENKMASIYIERSKLTESEVRDLFIQRESKDLSFAVEKGIIHDIRNVSVPKDAPFLTVNLK